MRKLSAIVVFVILVGACGDIEEVSSTVIRPTTTTSSTTSTTTSTSTSTTTTSTTTTTLPPPPVEKHKEPEEVQYGNGSCGGDLPSCDVMRRESHGNIRAQNPTSSASGKWQILDSTWNGYGNYKHAKDAPEEVQDAKARELASCHWEAPNYCG